MHNPLTTWRWAVKAEATDAGAEAPAPKSKYAGNTPEARKERARHARMVQLGKENPMQARIQAIREKRKAKAKAGKGGGKGKAKVAPKPKADPKAEEAAKRQAVIDAMAAQDAGLSPSGAADLLGFADGGPLDPAKAKGLASMGLVETFEDGSSALTPAGKAAVAAMNKGDVRGAIDAVNRGAQGERDKAAGAAEAQGKADAKAKAKAEKEKAAAEKKPKGGGGGGGKGKKDEPKKDEAAPAEDDPKAKARALVRDSTAREVGLKPYESSALRAAADGGPVDEADIDGLAEKGLVEPDGAGGFITTDAGRRALGALERGDKAGYRAALQDVGKAKARTAERDKVKASLDAARAERERERAAGVAAREKTRADAETGRAKEKAAAEAQELDDLADDYRAKRKGLSMKDQRRLVRAGRATFGKDGAFSLSATKAWRWAAKETL
jgi:hypothetical protein